MNQRNPNDKVFVVSHSNSSLILRRLAVVRLLRRSCFGRRKGSDTQASENVQYLHGVHTYTKTILMGQEAMVRGIELEYF